MTNRDKIEQQVEQTLNSLNNWKSVKTDPFFYTRLKAKMEHKTETKSLLERIIFSPAMKSALAILAIIINIVTVTYFTENRVQSNQNNEDVATMFYNEYNADLATENILLNDVLADDSYYR